MNHEAPSPKKEDLTKLVNALYLAYQLGWGLKEEDPTPEEQAK